MHTKADGLLETSQKTILKKSAPFVYTKPNTWFLVKKIIHREYSLMILSQILLSYCDHSVKHIIAAYNQLLFDSLNKD